MKPKTYNPMPSKSPCDAVHNLEALDEFTNSQEPTYEDRFDQDRQTLSAMKAGMEDRFQETLSKIGYEQLGDYAAGVEITKYNQIFRHEGEWWRAAATTELPYTTTGDWATEGGLFVGIGEGLLREELLSDSGSGLVGYDENETYPSGSIGEKVKELSTEDPIIRDRFESRGTNDYGTPDAAFKVNRTHQAQSSPHAFRDQTEFDPPVDGLAINSYDGAMTLLGDKDMDHAISFQSRITHDSTGAITVLYGGGTFNIQNGEAVICVGYRVNDRHLGKFGGIYGVRNQPLIYTDEGGYVYGLTHEPTVNNASSHITNSMGVRVNAVTGGGTVDGEYGLYVQRFEKGVVKRPIFIEKQPAGTQNYLGCDTQVDGVLEIKGQNGTAGFMAGAGNPAGVVVAPAGRATVFIRTDTGDMYINSGSGGTGGWKLITRSS